MLIAIEGIDGAGKSTLATGLAEHLSREGYRVRRVSRYLVPELTRLWRRLVEADAVDQPGAAILSAADYFTGLERCIKPALADGELVIADRTYYSHLIFFRLRGIAVDDLRRLFDGALEPEIVFYLSVGVNAALERLRPSAKPDFWEAGLDYRLGMRIGAAYRRYRDAPPPRALVEDHFCGYQGQALDLYPRVLPEVRTRQLDGHQPAPALLESCTDVLEGVLAS